MGSSALRAAKLKKHRTTIEHIHRVNFFNLLEFLVLHFEVFMTLDLKFV